MVLKGGLERGVFSVTVGPLVGVLQDASRTRTRVFMSLSATCVLLRGNQAKSQFAHFFAGGVGGGCERISDNKKNGGFVWKGDQRELLYVQPSSWFLPAGENCVTLDAV